MSGGEGGTERVTVNLSALSVVALTALTGTLAGTGAVSASNAPATGGLTKTDAINKALQFYAEIKKIIADGGAVYIREPGETEPERIKIF